MRISSFHFGKEKNNFSQKSEQLVVGRFFSCLLRLTALEEVNLSANQLTSISCAFGSLPNLQVLRLHSNSIAAIPDFSQSSALFVCYLLNLSSTFPKLLCHIGSYKFLSEMSHKKAFKTLILKAFRFRFLDASMYFIGSH